MEQTKQTTNNIFTKPVFIVLFAVLASALWGSATPAIKIGYELFRIEPGDIPTKMLFAGIRFFIAGIMVIGVAACMKRQILPKKADIIPVTILGALQTMLSYIFFYIGLTYTTGAKGTLFSSCSAFLIVLVAPLIYKNEKLTGRKLLGCLLGFAGLILITTGGGDLGEFSGFNFFGEGFVILSTVSGAAGSLYTKRITKGRDPMMLTGWQLTIGGGALMLIGLVTGGHLGMPDVTAVALLLYMSLLSAVAFTLQTQLIRYNPVSKITFYNLLIPVFGMALSGIFLHENVLTWANVLALVLVCCGIGIVNYVKTAAPAASK